MKKLTPAQVKKLKPLTLAEARKLRKGHELILIDGRGCRLGVASVGETVTVQKRVPANDDEPLVTFASGSTKDIYSYYHRLALTTKKKATKKVVKKVVVDTSPFTGASDPRFKALKVGDVVRKVKYDAICYGQDLVVTEIDDTISYQPTKEGGTGICDIDSFMPVSASEVEPIKALYPLTQEAAKKELKALKSRKTRLDKKIEGLETAKTELGEVERAITTLETVTANA